MIDAQRSVQAEGTSETNQREVSTSLASDLSDKERFEQRRQELRKFGLLTSAATPTCDSLCVDSDAGSSIVFFASFVIVTCILALSFRYVPLPLHRVSPNLGNCLVCFVFGAQAWWLFIDLFLFYEWCKTIRDAYTDRRHRHKQVNLLAEYVAYEVPGYLPGDLMSDDCAKLRAHRLFDRFYTKHRTRYGLAILDHEIRVGFQRIAPPAPPPKRFPHPPGHER